jgi:hypothetical protein
MRAIASLRFGRRLAPACDKRIDEAKGRSARSPAGLRDLDVMAQSWTMAAKIPMTPARISA